MGTACSFVCHVHYLGSSPTDTPEEAHIRCCGLSQVRTIKPPTSSLLTVSSLPTISFSFTGLYFSTLFFRKHADVSRETSSHPRGQACHQQMILGKVRSRGCRLSVPGSGWVPMGLSSVRRVDTQGFTPGPAHRPVGSWTRATRAGHLE